MPCIKILTTSDLIGGINLPKPILNIPYALRCNYTTPYLLTPWCRILLKKLTGLQLVKKLPAFHGTRRFITALTSVRHLSLSWASPIQSIYTHPTSWRSVLILSVHLRLGLPSGLLPSGFLTKTLYTPLSSPIRANVSSPTNPKAVLDTQITVRPLTRPFATILRIGLLTATVVAQTYRSAGRYTK